MSESQPNGPDLNHLLNAKGAAPGEDDLLGLVEKELSALQDAQKPPADPPTPPQGSPEPTAAIPEAIAPVEAPSTTRDPDPEPMNAVEPTQKPVVPEPEPMKAAEPVPLPGRTIEPGLSADFPQPPEEDLSEDLGGMSSKPVPSPVLPPGMPSVPKPRAMEPPLPAGIPPEPKRNLPESSLPAGMPQAPKPRAMEPPLPAGIPPEPKGRLPEPILSSGAPSVPKSRLAEPSLPMGIPPEPKGPRSDPGLPFGTAASAKSPSPSSTQPPGIPGFPKGSVLDDPLGILTGPPRSASFPAPTPSTKTVPKLDDPLGILGGGGPATQPKMGPPDFEKFKATAPARPIQGPSTTPAPIQAPVRAPRPSVPSAPPVSAGESSTRDKALASLVSSLKVPKKFLVPAAAGLALLLGVVIWMAFQKPAYRLVDSLIPLHMVRIDVNQVIELDITAYMDFETKLQGLGFTPMLKITVPEIPSPNLFSVYGARDGKSYAVIVKAPGSISPKLSFVSCLSRGTWVSTNGWNSHNQEMDQVSSDSDPTLGTAALWNRHQGRVQQLAQDQISFQPTNENRFLAAFSDHIRWYLTQKKIQGYKAQLEDWF